MKGVEDYDESEETVREYISRRLKDALDVELVAYENDCLYGDNSDGVYKGIMNEKDLQL